MFIGRKTELSTLEKRFATDRFEFVVIYGRRRVGKTALIDRFLEGKKAVYFSGVESAANQNLQNFSRSVFQGLGDDRPGTVFTSFQAGLEYLFERAKTERLVLAIDEYPYVAKASPSFASTLQLLIDRYQSRSKLMLILCGSSVSYMEDHVLAYKAPLYGRRTAQLRIQPFEFADACQCVAGLSDEDKALAYGVMGGTPLYLNQLDDQVSMAENIKATFFDPVALLFEEPLNLLKQEVREPATFNAIVAAIAGGASRLSEIATGVHETTGACANYLNTLISLGLVRKETPYGEKESRRTLYAINDNMFRFWHRFVMPNTSMIARQKADQVYRAIEPYLSDYMGAVFEEICAQYLWRRLDDEGFPVAFRSLGRWWDPAPATRRQEEIDIMGEQDNSTALFAECKWTNEKVDLGVLETLARRASLFRHPNKTLFLFAKNGFTQGCQRQAATLGNVQLVTYNDILSHRP